MGRRYSEPRMYRDKCCHLCGYYFSFRGLNGHIRFYHENYEKQEIKTLKERLFKRALILTKRGHIQA